MQRATSSSRAGWPRGGHTGSATSQGGSLLPVQRRGSVQRPASSSTSVVESAWRRILEQSLLEFRTRLEPVELESGVDLETTRLTIYFIPCSSPIDDAREKWFPWIVEFQLPPRIFISKMEEVFSSLFFCNLFPPLFFKPPYPLPSSLVPSSLWFVYLFVGRLSSVFTILSAWIRGWFFFFFYNFNSTFLD